MDDRARDAIRRIFLNRHPHVALVSAAVWLNTSMEALKRDIADGAIVAVQTGVGLRIPREEMFAVAMRVWAAGGHRRGPRRGGAAPAPRGDPLGGAPRACRGISATCFACWRGAAGRPSTRY